MEIGESTVRRAVEPEPVGAKGTVEERFDALARRAGTAYRREAPEEGVARLVQRRRRQRLATAGAATIVAGSMVVGGMALLSRSNDEDLSHIIGDTVPDGVTTSVAAPTSVGEPATSDRPRKFSADQLWALEYTGGTPTAVSGDPIRIGFVADDDWVFAAGLKAGVLYVNTKLGGAHGRPIELVECPTVPGDGSSVTACGEQFAEDGDLLAVVVSTHVEPVGSFYADLNDAVPILATTLSSSEAIRPGEQQGPFELRSNSRGVAQTMVQATRLFDDPPRTVALLAVGAAETAAALRSIITEVDIIPVEVPSGTNAAASLTPSPPSPELLVQALRSKPDALAADGVVAIGPLCDPLYEALQTLGADPEVIVDDSCLLLPASTTRIVERGLSLTPPNWIVMSSGYDPTDDHSQGAWLAGSKQAVFTGNYGQVSLNGGGFALPMVIARLVNGMDGETATPDLLRDALARFEGPVPTQFGPMECGQLAPLGQPTPVACAQYMGAFRAVDGEWVAIANGTNGKLMGLNGLVDVPTG